MEKGFLPKIYGGLGNQIFIVVSSWVIAKENECTLYIPKQPLTKNKHNVNNLDYYKTILSEFGKQVPVSEEDCIRQVAWPTIHRNGFAPWSSKEFERGSVLDSYFQYYPPLAPYEKEIRTLLLKNLKIKAEFEKCAFLHVRRGDYLNAPQFHFNQPMSYYMQALDILLKKVKPEKILVFSDDTEWICEMPFFQNEIFTCVVGKNEIESLELMASCKAGAICANSTFSWWGAFLGTYGERNPVIIPSRWIAERVYSLFPEEWISI